MRPRDGGEVLAAAWRVHATWTHKPDARLANRALATPHPSADVREAAPFSAVVLDVGKVLRPLAGRPVSAAEGTGGQKGRVAGRPAVSRRVLWGRSELPPGFEPGSPDVFRLEPQRKIRRKTEIPRGNFKVWCPKPLDDGSERHCQNNKFSSSYTVRRRHSHRRGSSIGGPEFVSL